MSLKIAYLGIDLLHSALRTVLQEDCRVLKLFTCATDNVTEFNTEVLETARGAPHSRQPQAGGGRGPGMAGGAGMRASAVRRVLSSLPITEAFPMVNIHPAPLPAFRGPWPIARDAAAGGTPGRSGDAQDGSDLRHRGFAA